MRRRIIVFLLVLFVPFCLASSISGGKDEEEVLAVVGEETITIEDTTSTIEQAHPLLLAILRGEQGKERLLRALLDRKLFSQEARREGVDKQPRVQRKINAAIEKILSDEYLAQTLLSLKPPSEKDVTKYYEDHKERFQIDEQIKVLHILLRTEEEAREVLNLIKTGEDFATLADERCRDRGSKKGGELGWIGRGRMPPAFEEVAFSLNEGEVSGIVKTDRGYHIIQLEERRAPRQKLLFEVKNDIRRELLRSLNEQRENMIKLRRKELEKKYNVKVYPERLSKVNVPAPESRMTDKQFLEIMRGRSGIDLIK